MNLRTIKTYYGNGKISQEYTVDDQDQTQGTYRDWHDNGQLCTQREYVNGKLHGTSRGWHEDGQLWSQSEWVNGIRHGIRYFWDYEGSLKYIQQYDNGKELVEVDYMYNNKPRKVVVIKIYDANIETTGFIANITSSLSLEGKKYEIRNC